jgi:hypothetical protein
MKNQNIVIIAMVSALAFALAPVTKAAPIPGGIPTASAVNNQPSGEDAALPVISIHSAGNILRGKTGSFVLKMSPSVMLGGMYVNFKVSGTAVAGVDYASLTSPTSIGKSGYGVISLKTLANPRGSSDHKAYSVVVTLEPGAGYAVGKPNSALIWITTGCELEACW